MDLHAWVLILNIALGSEQPATITSWYDTPHDCESARLNAIVMQDYLKKRGLTLLLSGECHLQSSEQEPTDGQGW